jgi:arylsulfatase A-like enzyme
MSLAGSSPKSKSDAGGWTTSTLAFWRREFGRTEPTRVGDLVVFPLAISATVGLIMGVWSAGHRHFLDPAFIGYSIGVNVGIQILILLLCLALAFLTRRRLWSGTLLAIGFYCFLAIPDLVKLLLPGVAHWLMWCIALLGAFQIVRLVNRHIHTRLTPWMIAVPALVALCAFSYGRLREFTQASELPKAWNSPNVLIIIVDTLRADHLSPYGYARDTSPYLTQLAQQGVLFENAIAPSSWTLPSHASMLTGLYPHDTHVETDNDVLSGSLPNLGNAMKGRGYRTAAFSANYYLFCRSHGFIHGFTHFEGYEQSLGGILEEVPLSQFILGKLTQFTTGEADAFFGVKNAASAEKINEDALSWIESGHRPFFVVLNYIDLHEPAIPPEPYLHMYTSDAKARNESMYFLETCAWAEPAPSCESERPQLLSIYDGSIRFVNDSVQRLLSQLNERNLLRNTIVVFTSDHGQGFGDHGIYGHGKSLYRQEIHVPLVFWKPGTMPASVRVPTPVSTTDIAATILDLTAPDNEKVQPLPGQSLAALWRSSEPDTTWPEPISELARLHWFAKDAPNYNGPVRSIVTPEWHYIRQEGKDLLFDWKTDPGETHDMCAAQPTVCDTLRTRIQTDEGSSPRAN